MGLVCHLSVVTQWYNIHKKGNLMFHHLALAGATIQVANLIDYNCHPLEDGNETLAKCTCFIQSAHVSYKVHMFHTKCTCFIQSAHVSYKVHMFHTKCTCFIQSAHVSYKVHIFYTKCTCFIFCTFCILCIFCWSF